MTQSEHAALVNIKRRVARLHEQTGVLVQELEQLLRLAPLQGERRS